MRQIYGATIADRCLINIACHNIWVTSENKRRDYKKITRLVRTYKTVLKIKSKQ